MKKVISIVSVLIFMLAMSTTAMAATASKTATVSLSAASISIEVGQTAALTAITLKQGSSYVDTWNGAIKSNTVLDEAAGNYVSTAAFTGTTPGTYTVTYGITMSAGKSGVTFAGTQSITITVVENATIVGAAVRNVKVTANYNSQDKLTGYDAIGDVYAVRSNGTETYYGTTSFNFSPNQESRNIGVTIYGVEYTVKDIAFPIN